MTVCHNRMLRNSAVQMLKGQNHRRILLIHTAVSLGFSLVLLVLDYFLTNGINETGGIAGIGSRTVLETAQQLLLIINVLALPFWEQGIRAWGLRASRGQSAEASVLLEGFRRFWPLLRLTVLRSMLLMIIGFFCVNIASFLFALTPAAEPMMEALMPLLSNPELSMDMEALLNALPAETVSKMSTTMWVLIGALMAVTCVPILYMFRLADLFILDTPGIRARQAMFRSVRAIGRDFWRMLKLDLSYWWYYLLILALLLTANLDVLLTSASVNLPVSSEVAYFGSYLLYALGTLVLYTFARGPVEVTYARVYDYMKD